MSWEDAQTFRDPIKQRYADSDSYYFNRDQDMQIDLNPVVVKQQLW